MVRQTLQSSFQTREVELLTTLSRIQLLEENATCPCIEGCDGEWISAANEILASNGIIAESFASAIYAALKHGRGKYCNVYIYGPAIVSKHFFWLLKKIYECFKNPASGTFAWLGIEKEEVVWLNDF